jgi:low affinity Fe/Cu permease
MRAILPAASFASGDHGSAPTLFARLANATSRWSGKPATFLLAFATVIAWAVTGPIFHYSDTWQLVINTGTTIVTFLMVFLIQNTQNRDTLALQIKLSELIVALKEADDAIAYIEDASDEELERHHKKYKEIAKSGTLTSDERRTSTP